MKDLVQGKKLARSDIIIFVSDASSRMCSDILTSGIAKVSSNTAEEFIACSPQPRKRVSRVCAIECDTRKLTGTPLYTLRPRDL